ncbi:MAG: hypothetical protein MJZ24_01820 [Paludibacteraceae bacterium]|nr:hypothetical protein [Paludibacteraceae bacterium]
MKKISIITVILLSCFSALWAQESEKRNAFIIFDNVYLPIELENNAIADTLIKRMPFTTEINNYNDEIFYMETDLRINESQTTTIEKGLLFYHPATQRIMFAHKEFSVPIDILLIGKVTENGLRKIEKISSNVSEVTLEQ